MILKRKKAFFLAPTLFLLALLLSLFAPLQLHAGADAAFTDKEAETFIAEWVRLSEDNKNFDAVMGMYSEEVEFYRHGTVKKALIAEDKRKYFNRWPQREHRIISVVLHSGAKDNEKQAEILFHYKIGNAQKSLEGDSKTHLSLRKTRTAVLIFSEKDAPSVKLSNTEYLVWSGYGETAWIDAQGVVLRRSREKTPVVVLNDTVHSIRIGKRPVKQVDCDDTRFISDPDIKPTLKDAIDRQLSIRTHLLDGKERDTVLLMPEDNDAGEGETEIEILGAAGPWLFVERSVYSYVCGGPHGATAKELLIVNMENLTTVAVYPGQKRDEVEQSMLEESKLTSSRKTLFSGKEHQALINILIRKARKDIENAEDDGEFRITRVAPIVANGKLGVEVLLTVPTGYASSDGKWSSYTRSASYASPVLPEILMPFRDIPPAVHTWWKANRKDGYPSWSEIRPSSPIRQQLEKMF